MARKKLIISLSITGVIIVATALTLGLVFWQHQPPVVDTVAPVVEILTPQDNGIYYPQQQNFIIEATDNVEIDRIWYNWDGVNVTYTESIIINFSEGTKTIYAWANDTSGNVGMASATFYISRGEFITAWDTARLSTNSSAENQLKLPLEATGSYNFRVNWGDGTTDRITTWNQAETLHTYNSTGVYTVKITGELVGWRFAGDGDRLKLVDIMQWGDLRVGNNGNYFAGCMNLNITAKDGLDLRGTTILTGMFAYCITLKAIPNSHLWDVSKVTDMRDMFFNAINFNGELNSWNTSSVQTMREMFTYAFKFDQDISSWDTGNVIDMYCMFYCAQMFNQKLNWNTAKVEDMSWMFGSASAFNQPLSTWNTSNVKDMSFMFYYATSFNGNICTWDTSGVEDMQHMFDNAHDFNEPIGTWNTSRVTNMAYMFANTAYFNQSIGSWDTSSVTDMQHMFESATVFNQDISAWDTSSVTNMQYMFHSAQDFNQNISQWDTANVEDMSYMFYDALKFNQNIGHWNTSKVTTMAGMFYFAMEFNQNISQWDTSSVTNMQLMFSGGISFDQNLGGWDVSNVSNMTDMFKWVTLSTANYDALLIGWSALTLQNGVNFHGGDSKYSAGAAATARAYIINTFGWTITDGGQV